jgi:CRP-like cAMP-binding protein
MVNPKGDTMATGSDLGPAYHFAIDIQALLASVAGSEWTRCSYAKGAHLVDQGAESEGVFLISDGMVKLVHTAETGKVVTLGLRSAGCLICLAGVARRFHPAVSAITLTKTLAFRISRLDLSRLLNAKPSVAEQICNLLCRETADTMTEYAFAKSASARERLLQTLRSLGKGARRDCAEISLPFAERELAELLGITPEHLSRLMARLRSEGVLMKKGGQFKLGGAA